MASENKIKVLGISSSPRVDGNTELLLKEAMRGAEDEGATTEIVRIRNLSFSPCHSCGYCEKQGECHLKDDFPSLMIKMLQADVLFFATPIYFMSVCAWGKMAIDRCQVLWARKYKLNLEVRDTTKKWGGLVIAVGGSRSVKMFDSIRLTMKYFFDVLEINETDEVFFNQVDERGVIKERPGALEEAYQKARKIVKLVAINRGITTPS